MTYSTNHIITINVDLYNFLNDANCINYLNFYFDHVIKPDSIGFLALDDTVK
ncbi:hypothetical protein IAI10_03415 [Clostridium sp. 19966]|uniref:hypothetical protein n=1 Tax=Clostridium sp. 19966 TaxID=2768166 RepID=UPI0028DFF38B|nr:hypothetical protein [Clostridium sp. 19966]MDT8715708.1 hypothetical protein [Clostridium sp. 19966]